MQFSQGEGRPGLNRTNSKQTTTMHYKPSLVCAFEIHSRVKLMAASDREKELEGKCDSHSDGK